MYNYQLVSYISVHPDIKDLPIFLLPVVCLFYTPLSKHIYKKESCLYYRSLTYGTRASECKYLKNKPFISANVVIHYYYNFEQYHWRMFCLGVPFSLDVLFKLIIGVWSSFSWYKWITEKRVWRYNYSYKLPITLLQFENW